MSIQPCLSSRLFRGIAAGSVSASWTAACQKRKAPRLGAQGLVVVDPVIYWFELSKLLSIQAPRDDIATNYWKLF